MKTKIHYICIDRQTFANGYSGPVERKISICVQRAPITARGVDYRNNRCALFKQPTRASIKRAQRAMKALNASKISGW